MINLKKTWKSGKEIAAIIALLKSKRHVNDCRRRFWI